MLSINDIETLIATKKREIEREKTLLGLCSVPSENQTQKEKENIEPDCEKKVVKFKEEPVSSVPSTLSDQHHVDKGTEREQKHLSDIEEKIPPDLERYIRRYVGLPAMLKAGEYSPNNPLLRAELDSERAAGDAFLGLGEYERRRNTLRKIRQAQYRQYLDQQAKKKQEAKEQAERERREREEKERAREERERRLVLERDRYTPERRASVCSVPVGSALVQTTKVDTGVQVDGISSPLSVAVQTDDTELYQLSPSLPKCLTQAERELSPRTVEGKRSWSKQDTCERRRSYGDYDERTCSVKRSNRDKLVSDLRHSYMPSIFDADAIQMRNMQAEKEAAERRQFYQQELKNQILEQQRIREERKSREKLLEQAEMRRLEEQLRMLRVAQERERDKQHDITNAIKDNTKEFDFKRTELQRDIELEQQKLLRSTAPSLNHPKRQTNTSKSDTPPSKLPFYYNTEKTFQPIDKDHKPYSFNIPDNSVFSSNYDVDTYLRKNLNFRDKIDAEIDSIGVKSSSQNGHRAQETIIERNAQTKIQDFERSLQQSNKDFKEVVERNLGNEIVKRNIQSSHAVHRENNKTERNYIVEKALVHEPKIKPPEKQTYEDFDNISIPVLRHSPQSRKSDNENETKLSAAMKKIDDKWKVPAVQKNILKTLPNDQGKSVSILTQLGSIRRQLQLEQLRLDEMLSKRDT